jgi:hypothetical protein
MTPDELQQLESSPALRIKFASIGNDGMFISDASDDDYQQFFADLPKEVSDWELEPQTMSVQTRRESQREARILRHGRSELAMVEHETGLEVIVTGVASSLASSAITSLVAWGWNKWKQIRAAKAGPSQAKVESTLTLEGVVARDAAGKAAEIVRVEKCGPLSGDVVSRDVADFIERLTPAALRLADCHASKLRRTYWLFVLWAVIGFGALVAVIAFDWRSPSDPPWPYRALVAALGGWLGGLARAVYFFSFDVYAFNHRYRAKESSKWAQTISKDTLDDKFDPLWVWHIWCLKPLVGATAGMIFALAIDFGLTSLGAARTPDVDPDFRMLVLGGLSGFFSDGIFQRLRAEVDRRG